MPSTDALQAVVDTLARGLAPPVYVGLSGGLDSTVLLHLAADACRLAGLAAPTALHVNHGVSAMADQWSNACRDLCETLDLSLRVERCTVSAKRLSEEALRRRRYAYFREALAGGGTLLLAHHADDLLENILLGFLRGRAPGEWTMPDRRSLGDGRVWRPLLRVRREELRRWAVARGLRWAEDPSNSDATYDRNLLRHQVLPEIRGRFQLDQRLPALASRQQELEGLADALARLDLGEAAEALPLAVLLALDGPRRRNVLRYWLRERTGANPRQRSVDEALRQLDRGGAVDVRMGAWRLHRAGVHLLVGDVPKTPPS